MADQVTLYEYFRASTGYRSRIALNLKGIEYESVHIDLLKGEHKSEEYKQVNPQGVVPYLVHGNTGLSQSLAILEYLDETFPEPSIMAETKQDRAYIRQMSNIISSDIHPFGNPKVWKGYLMGKMGFTQEQSMDWIHYWVHEGFKAYEAFLKKYKKHGSYTLGDRVTMADICLIPQVYNARRFKVDLDSYTTILEIEKNCIALESFQKAAPESHPSAPDDLEIIHGPNSDLL